MKRKKPGSSKGRAEAKIAGKILASVSALAGVDKGEVPAELLRRGERVRNLPMPTVEDTLRLLLAEAVDMLNAGETRVGAIELLAKIQRLLGSEVKSQHLHLHGLPDEVVESLAGKAKNGRDFSEMKNG